MDTRPEPGPGRGPGDAEAIRRDMADALAAIVYGATPDLRLDFANRYALEYLGFVREDLVDDRWIESVHPDDRAGVLAAWRASLATGQHYHHEHRVRMADGAYRRFWAEALPLRDAGGAIIKWYGVLTPLDGEPRARGLRPRSPKVDVYPMTDPTGHLMLVEVAVWEDRPDDPAAKRHPRGTWYRIETVEGPQ
jgi:PAS domain S-box-containing protein